MRAALPGNRLTDGVLLHAESGGTRRPRRGIALAFLAFPLSLTLALAGCGSPPPPPPPPTVAKLTLRASAGVNPNESGQASPVVVRVYQLSSPAGFEKAEFYRLFSADTATLGSDVVKKDEYLMAPGTTKEETLTLPDTVKAIGVFAAYREFGSKTWRTTVTVPPNKTTPVTITVGGSGLAVAPPAPSAAPAP